MEAATDDNCDLLVRMRRTTLLAMFLLGAGVCAAAADRSGTYEGSYTSTQGDSAGKLRIVILKNADAGWVCKVFFTAGGSGAETATKPGGCSIENDKIATEFDADVEGSTFHATLKGSATGAKSLEGTYVTAGSGGGDQGAWKVALRP